MLVQEEMFFLTLLEPVALDPGDFTSNMLYFPRISPNSFKLLSKYLNLKFYQGLAFYRNEIISFVFESAFHGFNLIYWKPICG